MGMYEDLRADVQGILEEFEQGFVNYVKITQSGGSFDDPAKIVRSEIPLSAVVSGPGEEYIRLGLASATDLMVTASYVGGLNPSMQDWVSIDGVDYKIVNIKTIPGAGTVVAWKIIVRKS